MIKELIVYNSYGEKLTIALDNSDNSGYIITGITGLEPVNVDIKQTQMVSGLKYRYIKGFHKYRNIQITIIYDEWNSNRYSIDKLRSDLYEKFKTDDAVTLYFDKGNNDIRCIEGHVEKNQATYFSNACGAVISIICSDPWFRKAVYENNSYVIYEGTSSSSNNTASISYEGSMQTQFKLKSTNAYRMSNIIGKTVSIKSRKNGSITGQMFLNIPGNIPSSIQDDRLIIDLNNDSVIITTDPDHGQGIGWLDITEISKRKDLPIILPGTNDIVLEISDNSTFEFTIYYNVLYRGL